MAESARCRVLRSEEGGRCAEGKQSDVFPHRMTQKDAVVRVRG